MNCRLFFPVLLLTAVVLSAQTNATKEVEITAEPSHHLALDNNYVRVFKVEVAPHAATLMHRQRHDYVFVTLGASEVSNEVEGNAQLTLKLQHGETHVTPGGSAHIAKNLSDHPVLTV